MSIKVTDNAFKRISELLEIKNDNSLLLRVTVEAGGCSGFLFDFSLVSENSLTDDDCIISNGKARLVIDNQSKEFIPNCVIDFVVELKGSEFKIDDPDIKSKCGCGQSFYK